MLIRYDRKVLEAARRTANQPNALQRDMYKFLTDGTYTDYGHFQSFLSPEARAEIISLTRSLPRRFHNNHR